MTDVAWVSSTKFEYNEQRIQSWMGISLLPGQTRCPTSINHWMRVKAEWSFWSWIGRKTHLTASSKTDVGNRCRLYWISTAERFKRQKLNASLSQHSSFDERHCHLEHRMMFNSWIKITNIISFVFILYISRWFVVDDDDDADDVVCDSSSSNTTCAEQSAPSKMATLCMRHIRWMAKF